MKNIMICGTFDDNNGKPSGLMKKLHSCLLQEFHGLEIHNGGNFIELNSILSYLVKEANIIFWFPNIDNEKFKIIKRIKILNPTCMLISSKRNFNEYSQMEIISKALEIKSNLILEINKGINEYEMTILDPLGNIFIDKTTSTDLVAKTLSLRIKELLTYTRVRSEGIFKQVMVPNLISFFEIVREYATNFHNLIQPEPTTRFIGNTSFRCTKGFPSFKIEDKMFISMRNIDKKHLDHTGFVPVDMNSIDPVIYYGANKPSIDTPIHLRLYHYYKNVNFILHSHVSISGAPVTEKLIPCGAIEEFHEIIKIEPNENKTNFCINLLGHGSIIISEGLSYFKEVFKNKLFKEIIRKK